MWILRCLLSSSQLDYCLVKQYDNTIVASLEMHKGSNTPPHFYVLYIKVRVTYMWIV